MTDTRYKTFSDFLAKKQDHYPYSDSYINAVHDSKDRIGRTERERIVEWFRANATKGSGSCSNASFDSASNDLFEKVSEEAARKPVKHLGQSAPNKATAAGIARMVLLRDAEERGRTFESCLKGT